MDACVGNLKQLEAKLAEIRTIRLLQSRLRKDTGGEDSRRAAETAELTEKQKLRIATIEKWEAKIREVMEIMEERGDSELMAQILAQNEDRDV